jgi:hypothetical protein
VTRPSPSWLTLANYAWWIAQPTTTPEQAAEARKRTQAAIDAQQGRVSR